MKITQDVREYAAQKEIDEQAALEVGLKEKGSGVRSGGRRCLRESVERCKLSAMKANYLEPEIVTRKGKPVSVILPIKDYEELLERAEDSEDIAWLKKARRKKLQYRPLEDYLAKRNGK